MNNDLSFAVVAFVILLFGLFVAYLWWEDQNHF